MTLIPLKVAVVGHTNTGKTSLMRTLMRDVEFGQVSDRPATTRHVEGATLNVHGQPVVELYDTPGLEDSIALLDHLETLRGDDRRLDGPELIQRFLSDAQAQPGGRFAQESKAIRQVAASDVALYVIDVRDRVLGKHKDELEILSLCGRPVVPVLNFVASPEAQTALWREHVARAGLHAVAEFDTVVLDEHSERRLFEKMRTLLDRHRDTLTTLIDERAKHRENLARASASVVAEMLVDVTAFRVMVPLESDPASATEVARLRQLVRQREQRCVKDLLELHRFRMEDVQAGDLPIVDGQWGIDLFSPAALKQFGIRTGSAAAAGAVAGFTIDAIAHGMTLGAATALGAAIGGTLGLAQTHGRRLVDRMRGMSEFACDHQTMLLLATRQCALVHALMRRGHASVKPIEMQPKAEAQTAKSIAKKLPPVLDEVRLHADWSSLTEHAGISGLTSPGRKAAVDKLTSDLLPFVIGSTHTT